MKTATRILTLAVAGILSIGAVSIASKTNRNPASQTITVYYGDAPVSLSADAFQTSFDPSILAH